MRVDDKYAQYPLTIDPFIQQAKLISSDGAANDNFGYAVAISGDTVVVGAYRASSAYVFVRPTNGWSGDLNESAKLNGSDTLLSSCFGLGVAIDGDTIIVGAPRKDADRGAAYVFAKPVSGWSGTLTENAKLTASDRAAGDWFGTSVAISGDTIVVGAYGDDSYKGSGYVFVKPVSGWSGNLNENAKATASDGFANDWFGVAVAASGYAIVIGAPLAKVGSNEDQGATYLFVKPSGGWSGNLNENAKLTASDGAASDQFGASVATDTDMAAIGAKGANSSAGAGYVFVKPVGGWTGNPNQDAKLLASDGVANDHLGSAIGVSGGSVVIGAHNESSNTGAAYVFAKPAGGWNGSMNEDTKLTASDGSAGDVFGLAVGISGDAIVAGAPYRTIGGNMQQGTAYVFGNPVPTPTPTNTATSTPKFTVTPTNSPTNTATDTPTATISPSATFAVTPTSTATASSTPTVTSTATATPTFTATPCASKPAKPTLLKPKDKGKVGKRQVSLDWTDVVCAEKYKVIVKDTSTGKKADGSTVSVSNYKTKSLTPGRTYLWKVKACNSFGCAAASRTFTLKATALFEWQRDDWFVMKISDTTFVIQ